MPAVPPPTSREPSERFDRWLDAFFAFDRRRRPVNATFNGIHDHDHELPDSSTDARRRDLAAIRDLRRQLAALRPDELSEAQRHDYRLAAGHLDLQELEDGLPQFQAGNPAVYTGEAVFSLISLFLRDSEPLSDRVGAATARMQAIPELLAQGRRNVESAPPLWTERAAREARGGIVYLTEGLPHLAAERGIDDSGFVAAAEVAARAFRDHAAWLDDVLMARPNGEVACGRTAFDRYLRLGHCLAPEQDASWVESVAGHTLAEEQTRLTERARALDPARDWRAQLADLADHHPTAGEYLGAFHRVWDKALASAVTNELVTWPDYPIRFEWVPRSDRAAAKDLYYLPYRCPPPFGRPETHRYLVPTFDPTSPADTERVLRATNWSVIKLNHVVHHAGLGHHLQNWHAFRAASRIGQVAGVDCASRIDFFCGGTLVEGWACYAVDLIEEVGFLTPLESLSQQLSRVRMAARAVADVGIHTGAMTLADATEFYEREAGMGHAAAEAEAVKNSMFPGAAMMYLIGTNAIHELRRRLQDPARSPFSAQSFHDRFLSYGAIPVSLIAASMLPDPGTETGG